ncbi:unnamed protein product, partial [Prorocentrum cordatum]
MVHTRLDTNLVVTMSSAAAAAAVDEDMLRPAWMKDPYSAPAAKKMRSGAAAREEAKRGAGGSNALQYLVLLLAKSVLTDSRALADLSSTVHHAFDVVVDGDLVVQKNEQAGQVVDFDARGPPFGAIIMQVFHGAATMEKKDEQKEPWMTTVLKMWTEELTKRSAQNFSVECRFTGPLDFAFCALLALSLWAVLSPSEADGFLSESLLEQWDAFFGHVLDLRAAPLRALRRCVKGATAQGSKGARLEKWAEKLGLRPRGEGLWDLPSMGTFPAHGEFDGIVAGDVYADGSLLRGSCAALRRGGWSFAQLTPSVRLRFTCCGPQPGAQWHRAIFRSDLEAVRRVLEVACPPLTIWADCRSILDGFARGPAWAERPSTMHAKTWSRRWALLAENGDIGPRGVLAAGVQQLGEQIGGLGAILSCGQWGPLDDGDVSRCSFTETRRDVTVPVDRAESVAPTTKPGETVAPTSPANEAVAEEREAAGGAKGAKAAKSRKATLTMEALKQHTEALAKAEAEAMRGTVGTAKRGYSMSVPGKSKVGGRSATFHGRSAARSVAASGVDTVATFRTHKTTRELLVGASVMREIMRSVSPISEPGVQLGNKRRAADDSDEDESPARAKKRKKKDKKEKKGKKDRAHRELGAQALKDLGSGRRAGRAKIVPRPLSPSHFPMASPTPAGATSTQGAPSRWQGEAPSASEDFAWAARKKEHKPKLKLRGRSAVPSASVDRRETAKPKRKAKKREERPPEG